VAQYEWSADRGKFYKSWKHNAAELTGAGLKGAALKTIHWTCVPTTYPDDTAKVTLTLHLVDGTVQSKEVTFKTRTVKSPRVGDDAKMAQAFLRQIGNSSGTTKWGWRAPAIVADGKFGSNSVIGTKLLQKRAHLTDDGKIGQNTLGKCVEHWDDYLAAYDAFDTSPSIGVKHADFGTWIEKGALELKKTYNDTHAAAVGPGTVAKDNRIKLLDAWVKHEAGVGHWGREIPFRAVLGGYDSHGSIGFSQIKQQYKYGNVTAAAKAALAQVNLYHPEDAIVAFGIWSNDKNLGAGFYRVFTTTTNVVTTAYPAGTYPRIGATYTDDSADKLSKGLYGYKEGAFGPPLRTYHWPELVKRTSEAGADAAEKRGVKYALEVKQEAGIDPSKRKWQWSDKKCCRRGVHLLVQ
jgi:hypothetical protein